MLNYINGVYLIQTVFISDRVALTEVDAFDFS